MTEKFSLLVVVNSFKTCLIFSTYSPFKLNAFDTTSHRTIRTRFIAILAGMFYLDGNHTACNICHVLVY